MDETDSMVEKWQIRVMLDVEYSLHHTKFCGMYYPEDSILGLKDNYNMHKHQNNDMIFLLCSRLFHSLIIQLLSFKRIDIHFCLLLRWTIWTKHLSFVQDSHSLQFSLPFLLPRNWYFIFFLVFVPIQSYSIIFQRFHWIFCSYNLIINGINLHLIFHEYVTQIYMFVYYNMACGYPVALTLMCKKHATCYS